MFALVFGNFHYPANQNCSLSTFRLLRQAQTAAHFHILVVHLQVVQWQTLLEVSLNPEDWGWNLKDGMAVPVSASDVNKDWLCKDKDKDQAYKDQDKD